MPRDVQSMRLIHAGAIALTVIALATPAPAQQIKALKFASVVDGSGRVVPQGVVIVSGDKIVRVAGPRDALPANAQIVDLTRYTAIPGLIDLHTHMTYYWDSTSGTDPWRQPPGRTPGADRAARAQQRDQDARDRRDIGARSRRVELHRCRAARFDQQVRLDRAAHVRRRIRASSERARRSGRTPIRRKRCAVAYTTSLKSRKR